MVPLYKGMMSQMVDPDERGKRSLFAKKKRKERKEKEKRTHVYFFVSNWSKVEFAIAFILLSFTDIQVMFLCFFPPFLNMILAHFYLRA